MTRSSQASGLDWRIDVPLLTQPLLLRGYAKAILISVGAMGSLLSFLSLVSGKWDDIGAMWMLTGISMAVVLVLGFVGTLLVMGNRMALRFVVDDRGVQQFVVDRRTKAVASVATVAGALGGSPGTAGAGLLAQAQSRKSAAWSGLVSARFHPRYHAVSLRNSWRTVLIVFCTPSNYAEVARRVELKLAKQSDRTKSRRNPVPGLLLRTVVAILACLPFFVLPWPFELDMFAPLFTLCFALAAVWLIPHLGIATLGGLGWMWFDIAGRMLAERRSTLDGSAYRLLENMGADRWVPLAIAALATAVLAYLVIALIRGRFDTALATDEAELDLEKPSDEGG